MTEEEALTLAFQALSEIAIIGHLADTALAQTLPPELSVAGFGVLNHFARLKVEGESPARLARAFQVTKGAMTYTLQRLEAQGYVRIDPDPRDARAKIVRPTRAGERARAAAIARVHPGLRAMLAVVGAEEFARALPFLIKLRQMLDAARN
ncbi:MAG: MarR family transcriptional regulator [Hydrogenophilaceae bacterium]|jgi:DNA-binding MarR family transcriptional regulator|nr:MarR family transcriptional regulator [Hydrogenophilaceae bacterium]